jgi:CelD/BcsL family acetyltransferase involved in cellulose biosynthesis
VPTVLLTNDLATAGYAFGGGRVMDAIDTAAPSRLSSGIVLQVATELEAVERMWTAFEEHADCTVFQSFNWLFEWHKHIGAKTNIVPVIVSASTSRGDPLIILPLSIKKQGRLRRLTWLGDDLCDYNGPLLARDFASRASEQQFASLWQRILQSIRSDRRLNFDLVVLQRMPEWIGAQRNPFLTIPVLPNTFGAHVATLGTNWEEFYRVKRSSSDRKTDRRKFRNLAKHGELQFIEPSEPGDITRTMELLIRQKRESYARIQADDIFIRPGYREFFKAISVSPRLTGIVHVSRLDVGEKPVATGLGLCFKSCYYLVLSSYENNQLALHSPGRAHLCDIFRSAIGRKYKKFDFTIGDEPYKREWSDIEVRLFDLLEGATVSGRLTVAGKAAVRRANVFICDRPSLRQPLSRLRRQLAAFRKRPAFDFAGGGSRS